MHEGYIDHDNKISIYTDHQIFNRHHKFISKTRFADKQIITLKQLTNLQIGDFVTHIDHGVGEFVGLHKIDNNGKKQESIKLIYKVETYYILVFILYIKSLNILEKKGTVLLLINLEVLNGKQQKIKPKIESKKLRLI